MTKFSTPVVTVIALGLAVLFGAAIVLLALSTRPPAPSVSYRFPLIDSGQALCPGDVLSYRQEMTVTDTPVQLRVAGSFWRSDDERTALGDFDPEFRNYSAPVTVRFVGSVIVPPLTPGEYEFRESATGENWRTSLYAVRFRVRAECP